MQQRTLDNTSPETARANVPDLIIHGDPDTWVYIAKASSKSQGFMASTKVMNLPDGALVESFRREQAEVIERSDSPSVAVSVALAFVPFLNVHKKGDRYEWRPTTHRNEREELTKMLDALERRTADIRADIAKMDGDDTPDVDLPDVETVSAAVHDSWMQSKIAAGVMSRKLESGEELMVPYETLSEQAKELDRGTVKTVYEAILSARG